MAVVVLVQRSGEESARYATWLQTLGHSFVICRGPGPPTHLCAFQRDGRCQLWEAGDLFIYDPWLDAGRYEANSEDLVLALRRRYPEKPLILAGPGTITPTWVERLAASDARTRAVFPATRDAMLSAAGALLRLPGDGASAARGEGETRTASIGPATGEDALAASAGRA